MTAEERLTRMERVLNEINRSTLLLYDLYKSESEMERANAELHYSMALDTALYLLKDDSYLADMERIYIKEEGAQ